MGKGHDGFTGRDGALAPRVDKEPQPFTPVADGFESCSSEGQAHTQRRLAAFSSLAKRNHFAAAVKNHSIQQYEDAKQCLLGLREGLNEFPPGKAWRMQGRSQPPARN